jgi:hypothetical protein
MGRDASRRVSPGAMWSIHLGQSPPSHRNGQLRKNLHALSASSWPSVVL